MVAANLPAKTTQSLSAYDSPGGYGAFVKTLAAWSAFDITEIRRIIRTGYNKVWVKSGVGDWYLYEEGRFVCRALGDSPVHISPAGPSSMPVHNQPGDPPTGSKPYPGSMYVAAYLGPAGAQWWDSYYVQPYV